MERGDGTQACGKRKITRAIGAQLPFYVAHNGGCVGHHKAAGLENLLSDLRAIAFARAGAGQYRPPAGASQPVPLQIVSHKAQGQAQQLIASDRREGQLAGMAAQEVRRDRQRSARE